MNRLMKLASYTLAFLGCATAASGSAGAPKLGVSYIERPPFYMTVDGQAAGVVTDVARRVLNAAKIEHTFESLGFDRILADIRSDRRPHCSIGWFKTKDREQFAQFSLPIYTSGPIGVLVTKANQAAAAKHTSLARIFGDPKLTLGLARGFSYGDAIDGLVAQHKPKTVDTGPRHQQLLKMLERGRISYMLASEDEIAPMAAAAGLNATDFVLVPVSDVPTPEPRYFMCSKKVAPEVLRQLDAAIKELLK